MSQIKRSVSLYSYMFLTSFVALKVYNEEYDAPAKSTSEDHWINNSDICTSD